MQSSISISKLYLYLSISCSKYVFTSKSIQKVLYQLILTLVLQFVLLLLPFLTLSFNIYFTGFQLVLYFSYLCIYNIPISYSCSYVHSCSFERIYEKLNFNMYAIESIQLQLSLDFLLTKTFMIHIFLKKCDLFSMSSPLNSASFILNTLIPISIFFILSRV